MQHGGCHPTDGCQDGTGFAGANFKYLSANVIDTRTGKPFFKPYAIRRFQGKKVGFIGMTLEGTPGIVSPSGITHLKFLDEADTANHYARVLKRRGVKAIVVLLHQGGFQSVPFNTDTLNTCTGFSRRRHGHRQPHDEGRRRVHHRPHARGLQLRDRRPAGDERELERAARDRPRADARAAAATSRPSAPTTCRSSPRAARRRRTCRRSSTATTRCRRRCGRTPVGRISRDITRNPDTDGSGENPAGNLIADAQLADTDDADRGDAVGALMNPGGVRSDFSTPRAAPRATGSSPTRRRSRSSRSTTSSPPRRSRGRSCWTCSRTSGAGRTRRRPCCCRRARSTTRSRSRSPRASSASRAPGAANPVSGVTIGGAALEPGRDLPDHDEQLPRRRRGRLPVAEGGDRTARRCRTSTSTRWCATCKPSLTGAAVGPPALDRIATTP